MLKKYTAIYFVFLSVLFTFNATAQNKDNVISASSSEQAAVPVTTVYKSIDKNGNPTFTNTPPVDTGEKPESIPIHATNTIPAIKITATRASSNDIDEAEDDYEELLLEKNISEEDGEWDRMLLLTPTPELIPGDRYQIMLDNEPTDIITSEGLIESPYLEPGPHIIQAHIIDQNDDVQIQSNPLFIKDAVAAGGHFRRLRQKCQTIRVLTSPLTSIITATSPRQRLEAEKKKCLRSPLSYFNDYKEPPRSSSTYPPRR